MSEWQPIDTAPEGQWILCHYSKEITDKDVTWSWPPGSVRYYVYIKNGGYWFDNDDIDCVAPTHWMPLPPPPKTTESAIDDGAGE